MELRQVQYFLGVVRAGSLGRAADELHVAKSALSRQIKLLEEELGADLLLRGGGRREVELTPAGAAFMEHAVTIAEAMDQSREQVRDLGGVSRGSVSVMVAQGWDAWPGWTEIVTEFRRQNPALAVKVAQGESLDAITGALLSGSADLAIAADTDLPAAAGLTVEVLTAERLCVVVPPDHPLAGAAEVELGDLRDERWVLPPIERALLTRLAAQHAGFEPIIEDDAPTPALVRSLLLGGAGIGVCGPSEAGFYEPAVALALTGPEVMISIFMAYRSNYRSHGTRAVRDYMRGIFGLMDEAQAT